MKRRITGLVILLLVGITGVFLYTQRQYVHDQYVVLTTTLQPRSAALLPSLDLTKSGTFYYQASRPLVLPASDFNNSCGKVIQEQTIVLGCYTNKRFYVYDVNDEQLSGVQEVTAAHELLHAVYERLSVSEKQELGKELRATAASIDNQRFNDTIQQYKISEPGQIENELHSILGTEIAVLPRSLEEHYSKYFKDRQKIVYYAKQYESVFTKNEDQIKEYDQQLAELRTQIDSLSTTLDKQQQSISTSKTRLDTLKNTENIQAYNQAVPVYNQLVNSYNNTLSELKNRTNEYNAIVEARNSLAAAQNELVKKLDSTYQPIEQ